jgi:hypothetical protein
MAGAAAPAFFSGFGLRLEPRRGFPGPAARGRYRLVKYTTTVCGLFVAPVAQTVIRPL